MLSEGIMESLFFKAQLNAAKAEEERQKKQRTNAADGKLLQIWLILIQVHRQSLEIRVV